MAPTLGFHAALEAQQAALTSQLDVFSQTVATNRSVLRGLGAGERQAVLRMYKELDTLHSQSRTMLLSLTAAEVAGHKARADAAEAKLAEIDGAPRRVKRLERKLAAAKARVPEIVAAVKESVKEHIAELDGMAATSDERAEHLAVELRLARESARRVEGDRDALRAHLAAVEDELGATQVANAVVRRDAAVAAAAAPAPVPGAGATDSSDAASEGGVATTASHNAEIVRHVAELELRCAESERALRTAVREVDGAVSAELRGARAAAEASAAAVSAATSEIARLETQLAQQSASATARLAGAQREVVAARASTAAASPASPQQPSLFARPRGASMLMLPPAAYQTGESTIEDAAAAMVDELGDSLHDALERNQALRNRALVDGAARGALGAASGAAFAAHSAAHDAATAAATAAVGEHMGELVAEHSAASARRGLGVAAPPSALLSAPLGDDAGAEQLRADNDALRAAQAAHDTQVVAIERKLHELSSSAIARIAGLQGDVRRLEEERTAHAHAAALASSVLPAAVPATPVPSTLAATLDASAVFFSASPRVTALRASETALASAQRSEAEARAEAAEARAAAARNAEELTVARDAADTARARFAAVRAEERTARGEAQAHAAATAVAQSEMSRLRAASDGADAQIAALVLREDETVQRIALQRVEIMRLEKALAALSAAGGVERGDAAAGEGGAAAAAAALSAALAKIRDRDAQLVEVHAELAQARDELRNARTANVAEPAAPKRNAPGATRPGLVVRPPGEERVAGASAEESAALEKLVALRRNLRDARAEAASRKAAIKAANDLCLASEVRIAALTKLASERAGTISVLQTSLAVATERAGQLVVAGAGVESVRAAEAAAEALVARASEAAAAAAAAAPRRAADVARIAALESQLEAAARVVAALSAGDAPAAPPVSADAPSGARATDERRLRAMFDGADKNGDGVINVRELMLALRHDAELAALLHLPSHIRQVSVLLSTVTCYANRAHNLTRSP
jgi:chromosome segregation ATPase